MTLDEPGTGGTGAAMGADEQETLSRRHDPVGIKVRRLKSGVWALYDGWSRPIGLVPAGSLESAVSWETDHYGSFHRMPEAAQAAPVRQAAKAAPKTSMAREAAEALLKDLGL